MGSLGRVWREADYGTTDWENVIADLLAGEYKNPIGVITCVAEVIVKAADGDVVIFPGARRPY